MVIQEILFNLANLLREIYTGSFYTGCADTFFAGKFFFLPKSLVLKHWVALAAELQGDLGN